MTRIIYLVPLLFLAGCAGMSTAETVGVAAAGATAGGTFLAEMLGIIRPFLEPEQAAKLTETVVGASNWMEGIVQTVGVIGEQVAKVAETAKDAQEAAEAAKASGVTQTEVAGWSAAALATSRAVSAGQRAARRAKRAEAEAKT